MTTTATGQNLISTDTLGNLYSAIDAKYGDTFFSAIALADAGILDRAKWDAAKNEPGFNPIAFMNDDSNWVGAFADAVKDTNAVGEKLAAFKANSDWKTSALDIVLGQNAKHLQGELSLAGLDITFESLDPVVQQQLLFIATTKGAQRAAQWLAGEKAKAPEAFDTAATVQGEIARLSARGRSVASDAPTLASVLGAGPVADGMAAKGGPGTGIPADYRAPVLTPGPIAADADTASFNAYANDPVPFSGAQTIDLTGADPLVGNPANFVVKGGKDPDPEQTKLRGAVQVYVQLAAKQKDLSAAINEAEGVIAKAKTLDDLKAVDPKTLAKLKTDADQIVTDLGNLETVIGLVKPGTQIKLPIQGTATTVTPEALTAQESATRTAAEADVTKAGKLGQAYTDAKDTIERAVAAAEQEKAAADLAAKTPAGRIKAAEEKITAAEARVKTAKTNITNRTQNLTTSTDPAALATLQARTTDPKDGSNVQSRADAAAAQATKDLGAIRAEADKAKTLTPDDKKAKAYEALATRAEKIAKAVEEADAAYGTAIETVTKQETASRIRAVGELDYAGTDGAPEAARKLGQKGQLVGLDPLTGQKVLNRQVYDNQLRVIREHIRALVEQAGPLAKAADEKKDGAKIADVQGKLSAKLKELNTLAGLAIVSDWQKTFKEADQGYLRGKAREIDIMKSQANAAVKNLTAAGEAAEAYAETVQNGLKADLKPDEKATLIASMRDMLDPKVAGKGDVKRFSDDRIPEKFVEDLLSIKDDDKNPALVALRDSVLTRVRLAFAAKNKALHGPTIKGQPSPSKQDIIDYATGEGRKLKETSLADDYVAYLEAKLKPLVGLDKGLKNPALEAEPAAQKKQAEDNASYRKAYYEALKAAYASGDVDGVGAPAFASSLPSGTPLPTPPAEKKQDKQETAGNEEKKPVELTGRETVVSVFSPSNVARPDIVIDMSENPMLIDTLPQLFQDVRPDALKAIAGN